MKRTLLLVVIALLFVSSTSLAQTIYAIDSSRTELHNGTDPMVDTVRSDASKLSVRGDAKAMKSWIEFDLSGIDISSLTSAQLRITLQADKSSNCLVSAVNDDVTSGVIALDGSITWNSAPGNITSSDGVNPNDGSFTVDDLQDKLDPTLTTLIGTVDYTGGTAGTQYFIDVLSILQADTDGVVLFALHGAGGSTNFCTHDISSGEDYYPALVLVPEPATMILLGLGSLAALKRRR